ncbi:MAG: hypothetical protein RDV48_11220 [Candidatus Eremiobacteraeota bacterium]|nr:hypothetical protein [Candidatus Eremiobacteraeota bacterium]
MSEFKLILRTADKSRKAEITIPGENTVGDLIDGAITNWSLPSDTDYTIVNATTGKTLNPSHSLIRAELHDGDTLEIQPVLTAGGR